MILSQKLSLILKVHKKNASGKDEPISGKITIEFNDINKGKALTFPDFSEFKEVK